MSYRPPVTGPPPAPYTGPSTNPHGYSVSTTAAFQANPPPLPNQPPPPAGTPRQALYDPSRQQPSAQAGSSTGPHYSAGGPPGPSRGPPPGSGGQMGAAEQYSKLQRDQKDQRDKDAQAKAGPSKKGPGVFAVPLRQMMFGFGDELDGPEESVAVMEDLLGHFIQELCTLPPLPTTHPLHLLHPPSLKPRLVTAPHLRSNLASSPPLLSRFQELSYLQKEYSAARKPFDEKEGFLLQKEAEGEGAVVVKKPAGKKKKRKAPAAVAVDADATGGVGVGGDGGDGAEGAAGEGGEEASEGGGTKKQKKQVGRPKGAGVGSKGAGPTI